MPRKLALAHVPTPLWKNPALDALVGTDVWVKRDDMSGGAEAGNKIRKLEYLLADAVDRRCTTVITCGGVQSNHARATALLAAGLGMRSVLLLRADAPPSSLDGNHFLDDLAGAEVRFATPAEFADRDAHMADIAAELEARGERCAVIPVGGSNALGSLGYVDAMREVREQLDIGLGGGPDAYDAVVHACGSGGTAAGVALGIRVHKVANRAIGVAVCDDRAYFEHVTATLYDELSRYGLDETPAPLDVVDDFIGPGYGRATSEQLEFIRTVARRTGLVLDPVYTGKALFGLSRLPSKPRRVLFIHTGGLPGLLAERAAFAT